MPDTREFVVPADADGKLKLDIGCGDQPRDPTFKTVDRFMPADFDANMWDLPLPSNSVDEIWSSHALEHVPMRMVVPTLVEWFRVLKLDGRLELVVPNFDYVARYWLYGEDRAWAEAMIFGMQTHDGEFHQCAFNAMLLRGDLEGVGFTVKRIEIIMSHSQESIKAVARKEQPLPAIAPSET